MNRNQLKPLFLIWGLTTLAFMAATFITASLLFAVHVPITPYHLPIAAGFTAVLMWFAAKSYFPERTPLFFAAGLLVPAVLFFLFLWLSGSFYDLSYDGQAYHQETIYVLKNGWNPFYDKPMDLPTGHSIWVNSYARSSEICAAVLYALTGHIEQGKAFNFMLLAGSFFASVPALLTLLREKWGRAVFLALVVACNPVAIYQSLGFYVDGQLASLLLCLIAIGYLLVVRMDRTLLAAFSLCLVLAVNNKFTAIGYAGVICIGLLIALYMSEKWDGLKKTAMVGLASALIGVLVLGFNPYVTNMIRHAHPFYPLAGPAAKDVVQAFTPENFKSMNRVQQLAESSFSVAQGNSTENLGTSRKIPFTFTGKELSLFSEPDVAVSGFGPLFGGVLLLAAVVLVLSLRLSVPRTLAALGITAILLVSALINPAAWWARYVPQLWVITAVIALLGFSDGEKKAVRSLSWVMAGVMAVNVALISYSYFHFQWAGNQKLKAQLAELAQAPQPVPADFTYSWSNRARFQELGIDFKEVKDTGSCPGRLTLYHSGTTVCKSGKTPTTQQ